VTTSKLKPNHDRVDVLVKQGLSRSEANRVVLGWSEPAMATLWEDALKDRPKDAPPFSQREAFFLIMKTSFGSDYSDHKTLRLSDAAFNEICLTLVKGIKSGHVVKRFLKHKTLDEKKLFHDARSEFQRLIEEDDLFLKIKREK
jgi:hypothetical protein